MAEPTGTRNWHDVGTLDDLGERRASRKTLGETTLLVVRVGEHVFAIGNQCTHQGAQLDNGVVNLAQRTVTCPAHGSMFSLDDGRVKRPPATKPVQAYDVKVEDGRVFVRPRESG
jgi:nitrite reductase/ring-hydroxylating ferredoxin subunit